VDEALSASRTFTFTLARRSLNRAARTLPRRPPPTIAGYVVHPGDVHTGAVHGRGAKAMFNPASLASRVFQVASYLLSSTLVPILSVWVLRGHPSAVGGQNPCRDDVSHDSRALCRSVARGGALAWLVVRLSRSGRRNHWCCGRRLGTGIFPRSKRPASGAAARAGPDADRTEAVAFGFGLISRKPARKTLHHARLVGVHGANYPINLIYL